MVSVPILNKEGRTMAVIQSINKKTSHHFDKDDVFLVQVLVKKYVTLYHPDVGKRSMVCYSKS